MLTRLKGFLILLTMALLPTFLIWLPFFARLKSFWGIPLPLMGMATIVANYDGPLFMVVAKTFYNPEMIKNLFQFPLPVEYYAAHFPLFPLLIRVFSYTLGYPYAMLAVTLASSFLALYFFNRLAKSFVGKEDSLWLTLVFAFLPARWLIVRSVGSAEPLFIAGLIASVYYFRKGNYWRAAIWGIVAQLTKSPGILLFLAYLAIIIGPEIKRLSISSLAKWPEILALKKVFPILLIPLSLLSVFILYGIKLGDFLAYFHSGDNIHLFFPPFSIFNYSAPWVGTFWLEEVIFVYLLGLLGLSNLIRNKEIVLSWVTGVFLVSLFFVAHRDVIRYALPTVPFLLISFYPTLIRREFKTIMVLLIIPIYLFSLAYISQNVMPISDWAPFL
ncbi:hypothetical protein A2V56_01640 [Candidatus Woesebacteria bacterium RBG_19FT_COMBO_42_9]|uniref:Glycosyltransferase RgtA/B/C/D-like domain-containing protein n=1 Tax=Candidatus Woesebacteria bacterium RBG_16_42_24 TaxID=1802485 RepID=A0A1F7XL53_9BACT|nr:MAG: hypothetical protein A2V97_02405 [Candidatus Woesebacteria bacterium RBG_16_42_24]OGM16294.1 MAG: hypothetical protein A2V56_01640 [Candidatus Woesebacteria bacterium RBG_19FT_COMBO_42_9]OGM68620.1 MAG: hypothetical protein A2985_01195 [Candidatus Woesebacteria bacterium RIFCSPLOWO2_01_FULL_43_11]